MNKEELYMASIEKYLLEDKKSPIEQYGTLLDALGLEYEKDMHYWQVGKIDKTQGWILHISGIQSQLTSIFKILIPYLKENNLPFKLIQDKDTARSMLDGHFGLSKVGKLVCIYPNTEEESIEHAKNIIELTKQFSGPNIPTDAYLGGLLYTRYGSFNPYLLIDSGGNPVRHIYNKEGILIPDIYTIPFSLPNGVRWPYEKIASLPVHSETKILYERYKSIGILKEDPRGNVIKALYLKKLFLVSKCVIKEGKKNMISDAWGRDITSRLEWQKRIYEQIGESILLPKIIDFFSVNGDAYLAMEFIKGPSIYDYTFLINNQAIPWKKLSIEKRRVILDSIIQLTSIINTMHQKGFVHRDISPVNFIVNKGKCRPIDVELAYSIVDKLPTPPFEFGTIGFMSPQQEASETPTVQDDIYSLGATILTLLTGLPAGMYGKSDKNRLTQNLKFLLGSNSLAKIVTECLQLNPTARPTIENIQKSLHSYKESLKNKNISFAKNNSDLTEPILKETINKAISGLVSAPTLIQNDIWYSRNGGLNDVPESQKKEFVKKVGLQEGISGVLYCLAKAKLAGFSIHSCEKAYYASWNFIHERYLHDLSKIAPGLYGGAAGIALAMTKGIDAGLLENNTYHRSLLKSLLSLKSNDITISDGVAGQGISLLQCEKYLDKEFTDTKNGEYIQLLSNSLLKDGYWVQLQETKNKRRAATSFSTGNTGIICYLLEYLSYNNDPIIKNLTITALSNIGKSAASISKFVHKLGFRNILSSTMSSEEVSGLSLMYIKAFQATKISEYKEMAEKLLLSIPDCIVHENLNQDTGITGFGELYLEAYTVFNDVQYLNRAMWIVDLLHHTSKYANESGVYWLINNASFPTADFMIGNSGIIHFLIRSLSGTKIGFRILK